MRDRLARLARLTRVHEALGAAAEARLAALLRQDEALRDTQSRIIAMTTDPFSPGAGLYASALRRTADIAAERDLIAGKIDDERRALSDARRKAKSARRLSDARARALRDSEERASLFEVASSLTWPPVSRKPRNP